MGPARTHFLPAGEAFQRKARHGSLICLPTRHRVGGSGSKGQRATWGLM